MKKLLPDPHAPKTPTDSGVTVLRDAIRRANASTSRSTLSRSRPSGASVLNPSEGKGSASRAYISHASFSSGYFDAKCSASSMHQARRSILRRKKSPRW